MDANAQKIIDACENNWDANSGDCNAFVKAVANEVGINTLNGNADQILQYVRSNWSQITDINVTVPPKRKEDLAKEAADNGKLVICGLTAAELGGGHGHVCVVVSGPMVTAGSGKTYPTGYWGMLDSVGEKNKGINYAFKENVRDHVTYSATSI